MNKRLYPISKDYFKRHLYPNLLELKDGRGRPALISDYDFFCAILYVMRTGVLGGICQIVMDLGIQFIPVLNVGVHQDGFGNYCRYFKHRN